MLPYDVLYKKYITEQKSTHEIADEEKTHPTTVRRWLHHYNIPLRSRSSAQIISMEKGRSIHPSKGKNLPENQKILIGKRMVKMWAELSDEDRKRRASLSKTAWENMDAARIQSMTKDNVVAIKQSAKIGSKLERFLCERLIASNFKVDFHKEFDSQHIDIFIGQKIGKLSGVAIEVNGPCHYKAIWGEKRFEQRALSDSKKYGYLQSKNFLTIIVKDIKGKSGKTRMNQVADNIIKIIKLVSLGNSSSNFYEVDVHEQGGE